MLAELVIAGSLVVVDGDSLRMGAERIRVLGVDAPEIACRCEAECRRAWAAKEFVQRALANARVDIERAGKDKYGRTLAHVYVNGRDLGEMLIAAGHGLPYHGERRQSWCY
jgi:endonuclease YncB( thermonuclease family)